MVERTQSYNDYSDPDENSWPADDEENKSENSYPILDIDRNNSYKPKENFVVYTVESIAGRIMEKVQETQEILGLTSDQAIAALRYYKWNEEKLQNDWLDKENKIRKEIGLDFDQTIAKTNPYVNSSRKEFNQGYCQICYTQFNHSDKSTAPDNLQCGHQFCGQDWHYYLNQKVNEGSQSIYSKCPQHMCNIVVPHSQFIKHLKGDDLKTYMKWFCKSYTDDNKNVRWCPYSGCDYCVEYQDYGVTDVSCKCGNSFCFRCGNESHRPCDCNATMQWKTKNSNESENITWIMANTKQCPKCRKPIEKNQGCNHMSCKLCTFEFCWLCLGDWKEHGQKTGGYYNCNKYEDLKKEGDAKISSEESRRNQAKSELDKYMFYFERYNNHDKAEKHARTLRPVIKAKIQLLHDIKKYPMQELEFLEEAINEVIKCRQVLKYTYVYGYFVISQKELALFQFLQENLEKNCDYLHELIEKPLDPFLDSNIVDRKGFYNFRSDLINYYQVTKKFYENLLEGIEKGLTS